MAVEIGPENDLFRAGDRDGLADFRHAPPPRAGNLEPDILKIARQFGFFAVLERHVRGDK